MHIKRIPLVFFGLWFVVCSVSAQESAKFNYVDFKGTPLRQLLGDPPTNDSPQTKAELEEILEWQRTRTPEQVVRARAEAQLTPYIFSDVLGSWFNRENLPATDALLKKTQADLRKILDQGKNLWNRPRPTMQDSRVRPAIEVLRDSAYPGGHATVGTCLGLILAELAPTHRKEILERAELIGQDRVIAGVHYSSDIVAGNKLGAYVAERLLEDAGFRKELAKARQELQSFFPQSAE
jgi:acid phosphatase (class A)